MKNKNSQEQRVINKLNRDGFITRNECLRQNPSITRLGAIINRLKKAGWMFEEGKYENGDYVYRVTKSLYKKVEYTLPDGEIITTYAKA